MGREDLAFDFDSLSFLVAFATQPDVEVASEVMAKAPLAQVKDVKNWGLRGRNRGYLLMGLSLG